MSNNQEKLNEQLFNVVADEKASDEARLKKVKYLVRLGADVNTRLYGRSVLSKAIEKEAGDEVQEFLREKGAEEFVISKEEALELGRGFWDVWGNLKSLEEIKELLKKGADVNEKDRDGQTALIRAAGRGDIEGVKSLAECGADLEASDKSGQTALMMAASWGKLDVVKSLAECGADLEAKDGDGRTALYWAASLGKLYVVKCLVELGADLEAKDGDGWTALMKAVRNGNLDIVKCLVEHGADVNASDKYGQTVLDIAKNRKRDDCVKFLEEYQKKSLTQKNQDEKMEDEPIKGNFWQRMFGGRD